MSQKVIHEETDKLHFLTVRNLPENSMDMEVLQQLFMNLSSISSEEKLKPVVIKSAGKNFSTGYDCSCHLVKDNDFLLSVITLGSGILQLIRNYEAPVVSFCNGYTLGAGLELALISDYSVGEKGSSYGFPDINFEFPSIMVPPEGFRNFLSGSSLKELSSGKIFSCNEAIDYGFISRQGTLKDAEDMAISLNNSFFRRIKSSRFMPNEVIKSYAHYIETANTKLIRLKDLESFRKKLTGAA